MTPHPVTVHRLGGHLSVLSIDVELHTGIQYQFQCLGSDPITKSFPKLSTFCAVLVVVSQKFSRKCTRLSLEPANCGMRIHYTICSPTGASLYIYIYIYIYIEREREREGGGNENQWNSTGIYGILMIFHMCSTGIHQAFTLR